MSYRNHTFSGSTNGDTFSLELVIGIIPVVGSTNGDTLSLEPVESSIIILRGSLVGGGVIVVVWVTVQVCTVVLSCITVHMLSVMLGISLLPSCILLFFYSSISKSVGRCVIVAYVSMQVFSDGILKRVRYVGVSHT